LLLYAVTDSSWVGNRTLAEQVEEAILGGATMIQIREKNLPIDEFIQLGKEIKKVTDKYNVPLIINDEVEVAIAINAAGVHVGQSDMNAGDVRAKVGENMILGVSAQTVEQALLAEKQGADYLGVGAVFTTTSKSDADSVSFDTLKEICNRVNIPVVAIGGINNGNVSRLEGSGIAGVAVISAIFAQKDIIKATKELKAEVINIVGR
jgi:thiamine-phosphate pyrophosphorylase